MSDTNLAAPPPEVVQGNEPAARDETGTIKDQQTVAPATDTTKAPLDSSAEKTAAKSEPAKADDKAKPEPGAVPDKYDFKAPEGTTLDPKLVEAATPIFKELGLTNEAGQKLVEFYAKTQTDAAAVMTEMRTGWRDEVVKNPALGDGKDNLRPEARANIAKAMEAIGDAKAQAAFKEALDLTGAGDHPAMIAAMNTLGKLLSEGTLVAGGRPAPTGQVAPGAPKLSAAQRMFPNLPSSNARS